MYLTRRGKRRLIAASALLVAIVLAVAGVVIGRAIQKDRLAREARTDGLAAHQAGEYELALDRLSYALARRHDDLEALLAFADTRAKVPEANSQHLVSAIGLYREALKLDDNNRTALDALLRLHQELGRRVEWMDIADRILALDENDLNALAAKADGHYHERRFDEALRHGQRISELQPEELQWRWFQIKARRAAGASEPELLAQCDEWIEAYQGDGRFHLLKVQLLLELGLRDEARSAAQEAASVAAATTFDVLHAMVSLLDALQLREQAREVIAQAKRNFPNQPWVYEAAVRRLWQSGQLDAARAELAEADRALDQPARGLLRWAALVNTALGRADDADAALDVLLESAHARESDDRDADRAWALALRARRTLESDRADAMAAYEQALAIDPTDPILHYMHGEAKARFGEHELAIASFRRAARLDEHWIAPHLALADSLRAAGRPAQALEVMAALLARRPDAGMQAWVSLARAWVSAREHGAAPDALSSPWRRLDIVAGLRSLREQFPDEPQIAALLAEALVMTGNRDQARALARELLAAESPDPEALVSLAEISLRESLGLERELLERAGAIAGLTLRIAAVQARVLHLEGNTDEAVALFDEIDEPEPRPEVQLARAAFLVWARHPDASAALAEALDAAPARTAAAEMTLAHEPAWSDAALIDRAIARLRDVLGEDSPRVLLAQATRSLYFHADDPAALARATADVGRVLTRAPESLPALTLMARLMLTGRNPDPPQAIAYLQHAVDLHPGRVELYPRLIALLQQEGDFSTAEQYLRRLSERAGDDPDLRRTEAALLEAQGDFDAAVARLSGLVQQDSADESQLLVLASLHRRTGQLSEAQAIYEQLLQSPTRSVAAVQLAAEFFASTGRLPRGLELIESLDPLDHPERKEILLGTLHQRFGDPAQAEQHLREAVRLAPHDAAAWDALSKHAIARGDYEQARRIALSGLERVPGDRGLTTTLALASMQLGREARREALALLRGQDQVDPALLDTLALFDRVTRASGEPVATPEALRDVKRLTREHETFLPAWQLAVLMHSRAGQLEEAARLASQAATRLPRRAEPARWAALLLADLGRPREALELATIWRSRSLDQPLDADHMIATLYLALGQPSSAAAQLAPHLELLLADPDRRHQALAAYLHALIASGRYAQAEQLAAPLLESGPLWQGAWLTLARAVDAESAYQMIARVEPLAAESPRGRLALAAEYHHLALRTGDESMHDRAAGLARQADDDESLASEAALLLAAIAEERGELDEAEAQYRRVLAMQPEHPVALNNLAGVLLRGGGDVDEALALSARALEAMPDSPDIMDTRAQGLLAAGRFAEAEQLARSAASKRGNDPLIAVTLARSLFGLQRFDETETELDRAERLLAGGPSAGGPSGGGERAAGVRGQIDSLRKQLDRRRAPVPASADDSNHGARQTTSGQAG